MMTRRATIRLLCAALLYLGVEGISYLSIAGLETCLRRPYNPVISALSEQQKRNLQHFLSLKPGDRVKSIQDPVLGWVYRHEANSAGMRDNQEYERVAPPGMLRIAAFGDSFTYGADVAIDETWAKQLAEMGTSLQVLNYGVGAYGLDQAYLRYLQVGADYHPHIVLIGYMSENLARHVNVFRAFYTNNYRHVIFTKPRFMVQDGELVLIENPLATRADYERFLHYDADVLVELGKHDYHYQIGYRSSVFDVFPSVRLGKMLWGGVKQRWSPIFQQNGFYNPKSEAYQVTLKIIHAFYRKVLENGAVPVIVIFPDLNDQWHSRQKKKRRYLPLVHDLQTQNYRVIDALGALQPYESQYTVDDLVERWGHYSAIGNQLMAQYILAHLRQWNLTDLSHLHEAVQRERRRLGMERSSCVRTPSADASALVISNLLEYNHLPALYPCP